MAVRLISVREIAVSHGSPFVKGTFPEHAHLCIQSTQRLCTHRDGKSTPQEKKVWLPHGSLHLLGAGFLVMEVLA